MYKSNRGQQTANRSNTNQRREYVTRCALLRGVRTDKDGHEIDCNYFVSSNNYWYINHAANGAIYGSLQVTGSYNLQELSKRFSCVNAQDQQCRITLFFFDNDAEYLDKLSQDNESVNRSFVCTLYEKTNNKGVTQLCGQVTRLM
jgi:hypothetical protein